MAFQLLSSSSKVSATNCDNNERAPDIVCLHNMTRTAFIEVIFTTIEQHAVTRSRYSCMNGVNEWMSQRGNLWSQLLYIIYFFWTKVSTKPGWIINCRIENFFLNWLLYFWLRFISRIWFIKTFNSLEILKNHSCIMFLK